MDVGVCNATPASVSPYTSGEIPAWLVAQAAREATKIAARVLSGGSREKRSQCRSRGGSSEQRGSRRRKQHPSPGLEAAAKRRLTLEGGGSGDSPGAAVLTQGFAAPSPAACRGRGAVRRRRRGHADDTVCDADGAGADRSARGGRPDRGHDRACSETGHDRACSETGPPTPPDGEGPDSCAGSSRVRKPNPCRRRATGPNAEDMAAYAAVAIVVGDRGLRESNAGALSTQGAETECDVPDNAPTNDIAGTSANVVECSETAPLDGTLQDAVVGAPLTGDALVCNNDDLSSMRRMPGDGAILRQEHDSAHPASHAILAHSISMTQLQANIVSLLHHAVEHAHACERRIRSEVECCGSGPVGQAGHQAQTQAREIQEQAQRDAERAFDEAARIERIASDAIERKRRLSYEARVRPMVSVSTEEEEQHEEARAAIAEEKANKLWLEAKQELQLTKDRLRLASMGSLCSEPMDESKQLLTLEQLVEKQRDGYQADVLALEAAHQACVESWRAIERQLASDMQRIRVTWGERIDSVRSAADASLELYSAAQARIVNIDGQISAAVRRFEDAAAAHRHIAETCEAALRTSDEQASQCDSAQAQIVAVFNHIKHQSAAIERSNEQTAQEMMAPAREARDDAEHWASSAIKRAKATVRHIRGTTRTEEQAFPAPAWPASLLEARRRLAAWEERLEAKQVAWAEGLDAARRDMDLKSAAAEDAAAEDEADSTAVIEAAQQGRKWRCEEHDRGASAAEAESHLVCEEARTAAAALKERVRMAEEDAAGWRWELRERLRQRRVDIAALCAATRADALSAAAARAATTAYEDHAVRQAREGKQGVRSAADARVHGVQARAAGAERARALLQRNAQHDVRSTEFAILHLEHHADEAMSRALQERDAAAHADLSAFQALQETAQETLQRARAEYEARQQACRLARSRAELAASQAARASEGLDVQELATSEKLLQAREANEQASKLTQQGRAAMALTTSLVARVEEFARSTREGRVMEAEDSFSSSVRMIETAAAQASVAEGATARVQREVEEHVAKLRAEKTGEVREAKERLESVLVHSRLSAQSLSGFLPATRTAPPERGAAQSAASGSSSCLFEQTLPRRANVASTMFNSAASLAKPLVRLGDDSDVATEVYGFEPTHCMAPCTPTQEC